MRKQIFKQMTEILSTIWEGVEYAVSANPRDAYAMLCDCYDASNAIFDTLQRMMSAERVFEYTQLIEALKEMLEELNEALATGNQHEQILLQIKNQLHLIRDHLLNEKLEVVFMPYSASMWDCMESIWKSAKEDPRCEAYVVPIPYYERKPDRSLGKYCYEGANFPKDVPIVHYEAYDFTARKPDIIYIHNPYDGYNLVTSVDPRYYSSELKKHTGMLVYIPYYFTNGTVPESHCRVPALQFADKVIVQSEAAKKQHERYVPAEKIEALGSPKVDRILHFEKNKPEIPESWKAIIGDKKVVLFNISLTSLLAEGEKALEKIKYVFSCFENRDDAVLLWRPHPLSENTMFSMRPQLLQEYWKLEQEFQERQIGVYDDTPDVERAIAIADAYYGDGTSSLAHMFAITGKPVMVQEVSINREPDPEELQSVWCGSAEFDGDYAWFASGSFNGLCRANLHTGQVEFVAEIPNERRMSHLLYQGIVKHGNKILLPPLSGREIAVYAVDSGTFEKKPLEPMGEAVAASAKFLKAVPYQDYVFLTPFMYPAIVRYDMKTGDCRYYTDWVDKLKPYISSWDKPLFVNGIRVNNLLLLACPQNNIVMEFNMDTGMTKLHRVGREGNKYWSITSDGKDFWLIQNDNPNAETIVRWNCETGEVTEYFEFPPGFVGEQNNFNEIVHCGKYLLAFPRFANMIVKIDIATGKMSEFPNRVGYKEGERKSCYNHLKCNYYFAKRYDDEHVIAMSMYDNSLLKINTNTEEVAKVNLLLEKEDLDSYISFDNWCAHAQTVGDYHYPEGKHFTLNKFLDYVNSEQCNRNLSQVEAYARAIANTDGSCGMKIHETILKNFMW